jgi:hypothetical protein
MNKARFDQAFSNFIRGGEQRVTPEKFSQILAEIESQRVDQTIELTAKVVDNKLQFEPSPEISVRDNEIVFGNQRVVVRLT